MSLEEMHKEYDALSDYIPKRWEDKEFVVGLLITKMTEKAFGESFVDHDDL